MAPAVAHAKSMAACKRLLALPEFERAQTLMIYLPLPKEVDVAPIALRAWQRDKTLAAPKILWDRRHMIPIVIRSLDSGLVVNQRGLREPADGEPLSPEALDLAIVPALAFDRRGNRLGRGAGFYDRFLNPDQFRGVAVGLGFREQVVDELPVTANDVPVHVLITDEDTLRFAPPAGAAGTESAGR